MPSAECRCRVLSAVGRRRTASARRAARSRGAFEPRPIAKHERRFTGFDDKILALYARGLTVREIQAFLHETCAVEVSADLISIVTDAIVEEVTAWQTRLLDRLYPVVFWIQQTEGAKFRMKVFTRDV